MKSTMIISMMGSRLKVHLHKLFSQAVNGFTGMQGKIKFFLITTISFNALTYIFDKENSY